MEDFKLVKVDCDNMDLAVKLQANIFPDEQSPEQVKTGVLKGNPKNYIFYSDDKPVGIVGYYFMEKYPECVFLNWFGILPKFRHYGYGTKTLNLFIDICKKLPHKYLVAYTEQGVNDAAIEFI